MRCLVNIYGIERTVCEGRACWPCTLNPVYLSSLLQGTARTVSCPGQEVFMVESAEKLTLGVRREGRNFFGFGVRQAQICHRS